MSPTSVPAVLALLALLPPQDVGEPPEPAADEPPLPPALQLREEIRARLAEEVEGAWQLDVLSERGALAPPGEVEAIAVFADGYLSLVIHAIGFDELNQEEIPLAQAGIFRFQIDGFSALQTANVIGHDADSEELQFERGGALRQYAIQVEGDLMRLSHRRGLTFSFSRMLEDEETGAEGMLGALRAFGLDPNAPEVIEPELEVEEDDPDAGPEPLTGLFQDRRETVERNRVDIVGGWRLEQYIQDGVPAEPNEVVGAATFSDRYMSLVIHAIGFDELEGEEVQVGQAGIFRYDFDDFGTLETTTVIGHANPYDEVEYESPGDLREYEVRFEAFDVESDTLYLIHESGTTLVFARLPPPSFSDEESARLERVRGFEELGAEVDDDG